MTNATAEAKLAILQQRAKALAEQSDRKQGEETIDTVVIFEIGTEHVGVSLSALDEIAPLTAIAKLPGLPKWLAGVAQVRGRLLSVLDLQNWLNLLSPSRARYLAVVRSSGEFMAILVDTIIDVRDLSREDIADTIATDLSRGQRATTKDLVTLLDIDVLLKHPDLIVHHGDEART